MGVKLNTDYLSAFINDSEYDFIEPQVKLAHELLHSYSGQGSEFTGWLELPQNYDRDEIERVKLAAQKIKKDSDILVVIGIGGSYLGAKAAIEFLKSPNYNIKPKDSPNIFFAGNNISTDQLCDILDVCKNSDVSLNVISKSGTTTETAIAFRFFRELLKEKYGKEEAAKRIFCTTDSHSGMLKEMADAEGYTTFSIPNDIGGRFSVLSSSGLLPIAVSGSNIDKILEGALDACNDLMKCSIAENCCYKYAALRNILYRKGKLVELFAVYEPRLCGILEWWKQLFAESEGKEGKGLFPASAVFSTDLHSIGQFIQDGSKIMFETVLLIKDDGRRLTIKGENGNSDGLNFLSGKSISYINRKAFEGTALAHCDGGVPNAVLSVENNSEYELGYLIYFFEKACAVSGYLLGVNPFDQPGVELYKKNMFALLGKPGYENQKKMLESQRKKM